MQGEELDYVVLVGPFGLMCHREGPRLVAGEERRWPRYRGPPALARRSGAHSSALTSKLVAAYTEPSSLGNPRWQEPWQQLFCCCSPALPGSRCPFGLTALGGMPRSQGMRSGYVAPLSPALLLPNPCQEVYIGIFFYLFSVLSTVLILKGILEHLKLAFQSQHPLGWVSHSPRRESCKNGTSA